MNLRGKDIDYNPLFISYLIISGDRILLFTDENKINKKLINKLMKEKIEIMDYALIDDILLSISKNAVVLVDPAKTNIHIYNLLKKGILIREEPSVIDKMKCIKNSEEIRCHRNAQLLDSEALLNFNFWLEEHLIRRDEIFTEYEVSEKIDNFRKGSDHFLMNSFHTISAFNGNSAICHYSAGKDKALKIIKEGLLLIDSGGHYDCGTTDITRVFAVGSPTSQQIHDYTLVLKCHINLANAVFPEGTKGYQLDAITRHFLWNEGYNYGHGTGHGVGHILSVHEGPQRLSPLPLDVQIEPGMIISNEPGLYRENQYGIRLENLVLCRKKVENQWGNFYHFETLTFFPFEEEMIDFSMLTIKEKEWLKWYYQEIGRKLFNRIEKPVQAWLANKMKKIELM